MLSRESVDGMNANLNTRQEKFCQLVADGMSASQAYRKAGYSAKDVNVAGPRLMANVRIKERLEGLRKRSEARSEISRADAVAWLVAQITTPVEELDPVRGVDERVKWAGVKLKAMERLARMLGWDQPEKLDVGVVDPLGELLRSIRARNGHGAAAHAAAGG